MSAKQTKTKETKPKTKGKNNVEIIKDEPDPEPVKISTEKKVEDIETKINDSSDEYDNDDSDEGDDDQDEPDDEPDDEEEVIKETKKTVSSNFNKKDKPNKKTIHVSVPVEERQSRQGKTYKQFNNNNINNNNENTENKNSILRYSYIDAIKKSGALTLSECDEETILKYLIATTHQSGKKAICGVLKNTLSGMNGETNLPMLTVERVYVPRYNDTPRNYNSSSSYNTNKPYKKYPSKYNNNNDE